MGIIGMVFFFYMELIKFYFITPSCMDLHFESNVNKFVSQSLWLFNLTTF